MSNPERDELHRAIDRAAADYMSANAAKLANYGTLQNQLETLRDAVQDVKSAESNTRAFSTGLSQALEALYRAAGVK